ncbi:hypothetical protein P692DRAFT_20714253, partial [Suillus brevipes Sb2]
SALFLRGLWVYTKFAPIATRVSYKRHAARLCGVAAILLVHQAHSRFGAQVLDEYTHPRFYQEILFDIWLIGKLEV